jgi:hypothetical protein
MKMINRASLAAAMCVALFSAFVVAAMFGPRRRRNS